MKENQKIAELMKAKKWTELLRNMSVDKPTALHFETVDDMMTIRSVAARLNSSKAAGKRFSLSLNYELMTASVSAKPIT